MKLSMPVPAMLLLVGLVTTGCSVGLQADLSPDGRTLVQANPDGLSVRDVKGGPLRQILKGQASDPRFSPEGRTVAVALNGDHGWRSLLVDVATRKTTPLPKSTGAPFAWRPDGAELIAWKGETGYVYHLRSHSVARTIKLPLAPTKAQWLPGGRDLVAASDRTLMILREGQVRTIATKDRIESLGFDPARERVVWTEISMPNNEPTRIRFSAYAAPLVGGPKVALFQNADPSQLLSAPSPYSLPLSLAVSPDGTRLALAALIEPAPGGDWKRIFDLEQRLRKSPNDKKLRAEVNRAAQTARFHFVLATTPIEGGSVTRLASRTGTPKSAPLLNDLVWSADGTQLAIVTPESVDIVPTK